MSVPNAGGPSGRENGAPIRRLKTLKIILEMWLGWIFFHQHDPDTEAILLEMLGVEKPMQFKT